MRIVVQRVAGAECVVNGVTLGKIEKGLLVFVGVEQDDTERDLMKAAEKITGMRIFKDQNGKISLSTADVGGGVLLISNFTLCGSLSTDADQIYFGGEADKAKEYYDRLTTLIGDKLPVQTVFSAQA
jgi:D-tyrosyl-tRNA(Tyr) deacylase